MHPSQVAADTTVSTIKSLIASDLGVGPGAQVSFNGRPLADDVTLAGAGVGEQDLLLVSNGAGGAFRGTGAPSVRLVAIATGRAHLLTLLPVSLDVVVGDGLGVVCWYVGMAADVECWRWFLRRIWSLGFDGMSKVELRAVFSLVLVLEIAATVVFMSVSYQRCYCVGFCRVLFYTEAHRDRTNEMV